MSTTALLFVDLLGVKSRWRRGGRDEVERVCRKFRGAVSSALRQQSSHKATDGGVEADAAAIVCDSASAAVAFGCELYRLVFVGAQSQHDERLWLRGVIAPYDQGVPLRVASPIADALQQVQVYDCADGLMDAIAMEKSGFKGMRLLIHPDLISSSLVAEFAAKLGDVTFYPFKRLSFSQYPDVPRDHQDVLWMVGDSLESWEATKTLMTSRLRWAASSTDEFLQAAATQVVFHECTAIIDHLHRKGK